MGYLFAQLGQAVRDLEVLSAEDFEQHYLPTLLAQGL